MKGFLTPNRFYYENTEALNDQDKEVPIRPEESMIFLNGQWFEDRRKKDLSVQRVIEFYPQPPIVQAGHAGFLGEIETNPHKNMYNYQHKMTDQPTPVQMSNQHYELNKDTTFKFGVKDLVLVIGFVFTLSMTWFNVNNKITVMEKSIDDLNKKYEESVKRSNDENKALHTQINELERFIFSRKN